MMFEKETRLVALLMDLEAALRGIFCWDLEAPSLQALQSQEPFCVDTMEFYQWLQWIFIPRIYSDLNFKRPLPAKCSIAPMAQEWARARAISAREVIIILEKIDSELTVNQGQ